MACALALSTNLINRLLKAVTNQTSYTSPTTLYLALFTTDPTPAGSGTEVTGTAYVREAVTWNSVGSGTSVTNSATVSFPVAGSNWGTVAFLALFDASTSGNMLFFGAATSSVGVNTGQQYQVAAGNLSIAFQ